MTTLNHLLARQVELENELARVKEAIAHYGDATPVKIATFRNIKNTIGLTWLPEETDSRILVFADLSMTNPVKKSDFEGYILKSALAEYKLEHPEWSTWIRVVEEE